MAEAAAHPDLIAPFRGLTMLGALTTLGADRQIRTSGPPELAFRLERRLDAPHMPSGSKARLENGLLTDAECSIVDAAARKGKAGFDQAMP